MKFNVIGREVEIGWKYLFPYLAAVFAISLLAFILGLVQVYLSGNLADLSTDMGMFLALSSFATITDYLAIIGIPLSAFALLTAAGFFRMKKDAVLCRSLAAMHFLVFELLLGVLGFFMFAFIYANILQPPPDTLFIIRNLVIIAINTPIIQAFSAFLLYLWLLILVEADIKKLKKAVTPALIFALLYLVLQESAVFLLSYQGGLVYEIELGASLISFFATTLVFGLAVIYHAQGRKLDNAAYLFAALFLLPHSIYSIISFATGENTKGFEALMFFGERVVQLILIYFISGASLPKKF